MVAISSRRLHGRRILVTGGSGFLGSHLLARLEREGAETFALRRSPDRSARLPASSVKWLTGNLTSAADVHAAAVSARPDIVFHLAAYGATSTERDSTLLRSVNIDGTANLLRAVPASARFVMTGTCAEYGNVRGAADEAMLCRPLGPYAVAKHEAVKAALADATTTGRPVVILRPYGPFGPADDVHRVIPATIRGLIDGTDVAVTDGVQIRDFSYVGDHVEALIRAAAIERLEPGVIVNVASGHGMTIREALEIVQKVVGGPGRILFGAKPMRADDIMEMVADVSRAKQLLGFAVSTSFEEGVRRTVEYMRR